MTINPVRIAEALFVAGLTAQGVGVFAEFGGHWAAIVVGTEIAAIGIVGVLRA